MRAALISELGLPPRLAERPEPEQGARALIDLRAAPLNPVDIAIASGTFPAGHPPLPYVPGVEAVGAVVSSPRFQPGTRVYASGAGLGVAGDGTLAERFLAADESLVPVPDGVDDPTAAAFGTPGLAAWLALTWATRVRPGDSVLVLGATGSVGSIAVQAARLLGAGHVVAAGRDEKRLRRASAYGADATVVLGAGFGDRLSDAYPDGGPTLVVDCLWAEPLEAALAVAARGARIVHVGQSAGPSATILSGHLRGKQLQLLGYSNFAVPHDEVRAGYEQLLGHVEAGAIRLEIETVPLDRIAAAWERQARGAETKMVIIR